MSPNQPRPEGTADVSAQSGPAAARAGFGTTVLRKQGSHSDPLWFKDAIIYELHVKAFHDGNNDGIGDFQGLLEKLDYLQDLGVTAIWLLPFFPSPLRDDGYDIADYKDVHPSYGTLEDFRRFLDAAHDRGLQVIIELVVNHTSDQHPWFQRARNAPAGSPERDYYVWSDSDQVYKDARIIFTDTEKSNWTWDPVAGQYYWHRFFSHQPDVNFDNPHVLEEMLSVLRFWMDMGVDGIRLDAIPYLVERDGTNCENLPDTHVVIKAIRAAIDEQYDGRMILAEANQWPADVRPYFGDGDECHMAFHFPLMPRIYMALRQEDRLPITDIMAQTPDIPANCQWGLFLRNHDELTLEMVTDDERDYMYLAYSADPRMRINVGIRRRLAPLLDNNRRRIELLNALLFSFPGTPIIYYGDEIGMGDNIYLGDRNGVRTPMQWNSDRNAGFSRAVPAKLYSPLVMDPIWGYEAVNVEAQQGDSSSLLNWMRNMIALRKLFRVFGRGTQHFLNPPNRKVLAYIRRFEDEIVLCVANLSRFAQPVQLDLSEFAGMVPVEMLGYVEFPKIDATPYALTLGPYGFLWLELHDAPEYAAVPASATGSLEAAGTDDWESLFAAPQLQILQEQVLPAYLPQQRWFATKSRKIVSTQLLDWGRLPGTTAVIALIGVQSEGAVNDRYQVPLVLLQGDAAARALDTPNQVLARVATPDGEALLADATYDPEFNSALLRDVLDGNSSSTQAGTLVGVPGPAIDSTPAGTPAPRRGSAEQSNTSILYGDSYILKLFRRPEAGPNPDTEIGRYLAEHSSFRQTAPFAGSLEYERRPPVTGAADPIAQRTTLGMLQGLVANEGDGWQWFLRELEMFFENVTSQPAPENNLSPAGVTDSARQYAGIALEAAAMLGRRTAELHAALGQPTKDPAFETEPVTEDYLATLAGGVQRQAAETLTLLRQNFSSLPEIALDDAALLLGRRRQLDTLLRGRFAEAADGRRTRVHGDYHLGQTLRTKGDFVLLDFEGEPARPLEERRRKHPPLKDVAGMLRSFSYAANAALVRHVERRPETAEQLRPWALLWERGMSAAFLDAYQVALAGNHVLPSTQQGFDAQLRLFMLEKAFYELLYELNNRPAWVGIPLNGITMMMNGGAA